MKRISMRYSFQLTVLAISLLKILYAVSRPLFYSGPDANGYIPAALAFAKLGYFSEGIPFLPIYPPGYPIALSILVRIFGDNWIYAAQVAQIFLYALAVLLVWEILKFYFPKHIADISAYLLILSPGWFVVNGEAMYETLLFFYLTVSIYFFLNIKVINKRNGMSLFIGCSFSVLAISTHPRILIVFVFLLLTYIHSSRKDLKRILPAISLSVFINLIGVTLLGYLSVLRTGVFTLSSAFWPSMTNNRVLGSCTEISCVAHKIFSDPFDFLRECALNFGAFWSPHSGSLAIGSWFHNISLLAQLEKFGWPRLALILGMAITFIVIGSWLFGSVRLWQKYRNSAFAFTFLTSFGFLSTDMLVYGDNRHRLIALVFMVPAHAASLSTFVQACRSSAFKNLRRKVGNL